MGERQRTDVIEQLRERFGYHYFSAMEEGRAELIRAISAELSCSRDEADTLLQAMIDAGKIRYVPAIERDPVGNPEVAPAEQRDEDASVNALAGQGGPSGGTSGMTGSSAAPLLVAGGTTTAPAMPVGSGLAATPTEAMGARPERGYWDLGTGTVGVVPSSTRKGQVEPRGTT